MRTFNPLVAVGLLIAAAAAFAADPAAAPETRVVSATDAREGPGAFYAQRLRLLPGAPVRPLEKRGGWVLAEVKSQRGWIPSYVLESEQASGVGSLIRSASKSLLRSVTQLVRRGDRPPYLTRVQAAAGIRGFATAYATHRGKSGKDVDPKVWEGSAFAPTDFDAFVAQRFAGRDWEALKRRLPLDTAAPLSDPDTDKLGAALAGVLAGQYRLRRNPELERYLSLVATLVAASSHAYEVPVRVYVLDNPQAVGYVTPNGIVFISTGALRKMQNEAEFAFFIGHEIAHIAFGHGARKVHREEKRQQEEAAFAEMEDDLAWDERTDDKYVRTAQELSEMADQIYDYFQREANDADELEADYWGLIYAARAGYVPEAAESVLMRIASEKAPGDTQLLWRGTDARPRLEQCRRNFTRIKVERTEFRMFDSEFQAATGNKKPAG